MIPDQNALFELQKRIFKGQKHHNLQAPATPASTPDVGPSQEDINKVNRELGELDQLLSSPGWQLVRRQIEGAKNGALQKMDEASDPTNLAKFLGAYRTAGDLLTWPERQRTWYRDWLLRYGVAR